LSDTTTIIQTLKNLVASFIEERRWNQFHSPKNLSMSIAIEAAELMELFQWTAGSDTEDIPMGQVREELADVVIYCISLANALDIDIATAVRDKVKINAQKYPVEKFQGNYK